MLPPETARAWVREALAWLVPQFQAVVSLPRPLILPTEQFFPIGRGVSGEPLANALFSHLRGHTGLQEWPCRIEAQESCEISWREGPISFIPEEWEPAATFTRSGAPGNPSVLTYHPEFLAQPERLVALLAHGLSHAVLARAEGEPPGGIEAWDYATDLGAVVLGAGIFLANAAHVVRWEESTHWEGTAVFCQGWLSQAELAYALGCYAELFAVPTAPMFRYLDPGPRAYFRKALRAICRERGAAKPRDWGGSVAV